MKLDFNHTCSIIDSSMKEVKDSLVDYLKEFLEEFVDIEKLDQARLKDLLNNHTTDMWNLLEEEFENVRQTNIDMRNQAETQLDDLIDDYESKIDELEGKIASLEADLDDAYSTIDELECV